MAICSRFVKLLRRPDGGARAGKSGRLLRDQSANVLAITAAALLPMVALTGSAIDISRMYLVKSRLQAACDAGVLAGRKAMTTLTYTTAANDRAEDLFYFNFEDSDFNTTGTDFDAVADTSGKLTAQATATLPMLIMGIMGFGDYELNVDCSADIQVPNIDIVFVLDVTGSMATEIDGVAKIDALKLATIGFYDSIAAAMAGNTRTRVRYGFVPYSQAVNGSELFTLNPNFDDFGEVSRTHIADEMIVQSRVANFNDQVGGSGFTPWALDSGTAPVVFNQTFNASIPASKLPYGNAAASTGTSISDDDCDDYSDNRSFSGNPPPYLKAGIYQPGGSTTWQTTQPTEGTSYTRAEFAPVSFSGTSRRSGTCKRRVTHRVFRRAVEPIRYRFSNWIYGPTTYDDLSNYAAGGSLSYVSSINAATATVPARGAYNMVELAQMADQTGLTRSSARWNGCLEERTTIPATSFSPIPADATDLDYITGGTSSALRWPPAIGDLTYMRPSNTIRTTPDAGDSPGKPSKVCPSASMRNLREYRVKEDFTDYVNSLVEGGSTYLDVGMVWGLRLITPQGMFAARNLTGPNGGLISRHIIFLTDGFPDPRLEVYTAYGTEQMDRNITGNSYSIANARTMHARRFQALCEAERGRVGIWAVAFGTSVTGNLTSCADTGRAMQANNTAELRNAFSRIANEVADLRLVE